MTQPNPIRTSPPITIADRAGKSFPVHAHAQGYAEYKSGHVSIEEESAGAVVAKVRGQQTRDVRLEADGGRLLVQCTCPARTYELPGCKHVWATLLEVDRRGSLAGLRSARTPLAVAFLDEPKETKETKPEAPKREPAKKGAGKGKKQTPKVTDRASPRSPRASAARPEAREKPRRSPRGSSTRRR